ncbi:MAG TPA: RDD family protein [Blastocatellia bacterium]|nr:RDD family protein [Blastocatellia bacterium]
MAAPATISTKGTPPGPFAPDTQSIPSASVPPIEVRTLADEDWLEDVALELPASPEADAASSPVAERGAHVKEEVPAVSREIADPVGPAGFFRRLYAGLVDAGVIAFACLPFVSCVELAQGNLTDWRVLALLGIVAALVGFIYLSLLLTMGGRTVGMAVAGLLVLDARTMDLPSFFQVVLRMVGLLLGIASFGIGLLWAIVDRERRTFSDLFSRTVVRRVSESVYDSQQVRAPWLYRPGRR